MEVNVKFISPLSLMIKKTDIKIELENSRFTLKELFEKIAIEFPKIHEKICTTDHKLNQGFLCVHNNEIVLTEEINKRFIYENDEIVISVAIAGG